MKIQRQDGDRHNKKLIIYERDNRLGVIRWRGDCLVAEPESLDALLNWARRRANSELQAYERLASVSGHVFAIEETDDTYVSAC